MKPSMIEHYTEFAAGSALMELLPGLVVAAEQYSQSWPDPELQWAVYKLALARLGFGAWLQEQGIEVGPEGGTRLPAVPVDLKVLGQVQVGDFRVELLPALVWSEPEVWLPRERVEDPTQRAHFYVRLGLSLETDLLAVQGFLRYDELRAMGDQLPNDGVGHWVVPITRLNPAVHELLLHLQCLDPAAISLVESTAVLTDMAPRPMINVWHWCQDQWDMLSAELGWLVVPLPTAAAMRKGMPSDRLVASGEKVNPDPLNGVLAEIKGKTGLHIPLTARRCYRDVRSGAAVLDQVQGSQEQGRTGDEVLSPSLRLYAVTWPLPESEQWSLLLVLGAVPGQAPPYGATLRVSEQGQVLMESQLCPEAEAAYLFTQIEGAEADVLEVTVGITDTALMSTLFTFCPE